MNALLAARHWNASITLPVSPGNPSMKRVKSSDNQVCKDPNLRILACPDVHCERSLGESMTAQMRQAIYK